MGLPTFEPVGQVRPVGVLPTWSGFGIVGDGGCREIRMGAWSDPVEGRIGVSHEQKTRKICGLAKAMSMVPGLSVPVKGNWV